MSKIDVYKRIKYKRWTKGSIECYRRGCVCQNCPTFDLVGDECRMKQAVLSLVRMYGKPPEITDYKEVEND